MKPLMKQIKNSGIAFVAVALMLSGCGEKKGSMTVNSNPEGARVVLNGEPQGVTPLELSGLLRGEYTLELSMDGYDIAYKSIKLLGHENVDLELRQTTGLLLVESVPQGAEVLIEGVSRGTTPLLLSDLPFGEYRIDFNSALHLPLSLKEEVTGREPKKVVAELVSNTGTLIVDSEPAGANVLVDGVVRGVTPAVIDDVIAGSPEIQVVKAGYTSYSRKMEIKPTVSYEIKASLEALPSALNITTVPEGAEIFVDGAKAGVSPLVVSVEDGDREVELSLMGYDTVVTNLNLAPNVTKRLNLRMVKNSGTLVLDTEPAEVRIYIDGKLFGVTESKGGVDTISKPVNILLKAGISHKIQLVHDGYAASSFVVVPELDQLITKHEALKRIFVRDTMITTTKEVIKCRLEYKLPNGNIYYERYPGVYDTVKAADIVKVESIDLNDESNREARKLMLQNRMATPDEKE